MHLFIQIPCFNEEKTLPETLRGIPRSMPGVDRVSVLIIDDGSTDRTVDTARANGVDHVVKFPRNRGLAYAFMAGIDACLRLGADIIVNTDADNQYCGADIPKLVQPILDGKADLVVGDRQVTTIEHFSPLKKGLQVFGSWVVRQAAKGVDVADTTSGFRAWSREAALRMFLVNEFTYTLETIIQAGQHRAAVLSVPIRTNPMTRKSRLFKSIGSYVRQSIGTIIRIYTMYRPLRTFLTLSAICFLVGLALGVRFLYYYFSAEGSGHVQSLILAAIVLLASFQLFMSGLLADLIAANRKLLESIHLRVRKIETGRQEPSYLHPPDPHTKEPGRPADEGPTS